MDLVTALRTHFGFQAFRPGQCEAIEHVLGGQDTLVVMPTGSGKSLCYQLPALVLDGTALVISPLIALMKDQVDALAATGKHATFINSTLSSVEQDRRLAHLAGGEYKIVYVAPERLRNADLMRALSGSRIVLLAVDEAHCISQWGHDFRPDYMYLKDFIPRIGKPRVIALTATATPQVQTDIVTQLGLPHSERVVTGFNRPNLRFGVRYTPGDTAKLNELERLLAAEDLPGIIYTGTRRDAEQVAEFVNDIAHIPAAHYHAGLDNAERSRVQDAFMQGDIPVIVATTAFGMGVDKPDIRFVIHYSLPATIEMYYQEIGRAGRDGLPAHGILLYSPEDRALQEWFIENDAPTQAEVEAFYRSLPRGACGVSPLELQRQTGLIDSKLKVALRQLEKLGAVRRMGDEHGTMLLKVTEIAHLDLAASSEEVLRFRDYKRKKLAQMIRYAETNACRRRFILDYFGDRGPADAPECCDNHIRAGAATPVARTDAESVALMILQCASLVSPHLGRSGLAKILAGSRAKDIVRFQRNPLYGRLAQYKRQNITGWVDQLVSQGYLKVIGGQYPVVALSPLGASALKTRAAIPLDVPEAARKTFGPSAPRWQTGEHADRPPEENQSRVAQFLRGAHPKQLRGPWRIGFALDFNSKFSGAKWERTELGELVHEFKYSGNRTVAGVLGEHLANFMRVHQELCSDLIIPIPSTNKDRAYDPVPLLAQTLGKAVGMGVNEKALVKTRATKLQKAMTNLPQKQANVKGVFRILHPEAVRGKTILLLDDFYDSGATLAEATHTLLSAGAKSVCVLTLTKTIHTD